MTRRKSFSKKERARLFSLYDGCCHLCTAKIDSTVEAYEIEHVIPWALTQDDSDENLRLAHVKCHKVKTHGDERAMLRPMDEAEALKDGHTRILAMNADGDYFVVWWRGLKHKAHEDQPGWYISGTYCCPNNLVGWTSIKSAVLAARPPEPDQQAIREDERDTIYAEVGAAMQIAHERNDWSARNFFAAIFDWLSERDPRAMLPADRLRERSGQDDRGG